MPGHEHFRELSALAAIGQLSSEEDRELNEHLRGCDHCRALHGDYARVIQHKLPQADAIRWRLKSAVSGPAPDAELRDRFLARARVEGIEFSAETERPRTSRRAFSLRWPHSWRPVLAVGSMAVVVFVGAWAGRKYQVVARANVKSVAAARDTTENESLRVQLIAIQETIERRSAELEQAKQKNSLSEQSLQNLQRQLEEARKQTEILSAKLQQTALENSDLSVTVQQKESTADGLRAENEKLHRERVDALSSRVILEAQVRELTESLQQQSASLERERQLMAVSKDVRQLMGARNLHIMDVHDVDGGGKSAKAFGRVFYAEGQSLIFYAFDLPSGKLGPAKYTFQAWGQREYVSHSIRNLGTFEVDDHEQRRWVLKVTDPVLLEGIDSVFVTAESLGDAKEPRGKKLLYAFILGQANHP